MGGRRGVPGLRRIGDKNPACELKPRVPVDPLTVVSLISLASRLVDRFKHCCACTWQILFGYEPPFAIPIDLVLGQAVDPCGKCARNSRRNNFCCLVPMQSALGSGEVP
nr:unnamed protein product [Digitaria exilis]